MKTTSKKYWVVITAPHGSTQIIYLNSLGDIMQLKRSLAKGGRLKYGACQ